MSTDPLPGQERPRRRGKGAMDVDRKFEGKTLAALAVGVLVIAFAVANSQKVQVHLLVATVRTPLVIVVVVSLLLGFILGNLVRRRTHRPAKAKAKP